MQSISLPIVRRRQKVEHCPIVPDVHRLERPLAGHIGFELHGEAGFVGVDFPASKVDARAWHDLVGRYDGKKVELLCDGKVMVEKVWAGGKLTTNAEPLLIGAETDGGKAVRPFHGEVEEAAVWARALFDDEVAALSRR